MCASLRGSGAGVDHDDTFTISQYFAAFGPTPSWDDLCSWPPDVFALANLVLDHTEAYRFAVAPPPGQRWPPVPGWNELVTAAAREWRHAVVASAPPPLAVLDAWNVVCCRRDLPMERLRHGEDPTLCHALLTLHAVADETCSGLARAPALASLPFEHRALALLERGSLSRLPTARVRILPKTHLADRGMTIRSISRYLALCYEAVDVRFHRIDPDLTPTGSRRDHRMLLLPWPLDVHPADFRPVVGPLENMDAGAFGFFEFAPERGLDLDRVAGVLRTAIRTSHRVDAVILPEAAVTKDEVASLEDVAARFGVSLLVAGVRARSTRVHFGRNLVHLGVLTSEGWRRFEQAKHHRWCLDEGQIRQYHLSRVLDPTRRWWEAIDLPERTIEILDMGRGATVAPLVCEDLARMDEVADVLRRVGPTLIVALLLDGPQLMTRWPCRYASVLADEPGAAVLTVTSLGMAVRSRPPGCRRSRVVALWNDPSRGLREIELARGASAVLITASIGRKTVWTADGRSHEGTTPDLVLRGVQQLGTR